MTGPESELAQARDRWKDRAPSVYSFVIANGCECSPEMTKPARVLVENGAVVSRTYVQGGEPVPPTLAESFPSVDGLFDSIERLIRENAYRLDVTYHATDGYPVDISVDKHKDFVDDEYFIHVTDLYPEVQALSAR